MAHQGNYWDGALELRVDFGFRRLTERCQRGNGEKPLRKVARLLNMINAKRVDSKGTRSAEYAPLRLQNERNLKRVTRPVIADVDVKNQLCRMRQNPVTT